MRVIVAGVLLAITAALLYFFVRPQPADVFKMPVSEAYARLAAVTPPQTKTAEELGIHNAITGNGRDTLYYGRSGGDAKKCEIKLAPSGEDQTHVTVICDKGMVSDNGPAAILHHYGRNRLIEIIDSTLTGRAFSDERAKGSTAHRWPNDGIEGVGYGKAVGSALKADADMRKMEREVRRDSEDANFNSGGEESSEFAE